MLTIPDKIIQKALSKVLIPLEFTIAFCSTISTLSSSLSILAMNLSFCFNTVVTLSSILAIAMTASESLSILVSNFSSLFDTSLLT